MNTWIELDGKIQCQFTKPMIFLYTKFIWNQRVKILKKQHWWRIHITQHQGLLSSYSNSVETGLSSFAWERTPFVLYWCGSGWLTSFLLQHDLPIVNTSIHPVLMIPQTPTLSHPWYLLGVPAFRPQMVPADTSELGFFPVCHLASLRVWLSIQYRLLFFLLWLIWSLEIISLSQTPLSLMELLWNQVDRAESRAKR